MRSIAFGLVACAVLAVGFLAGAMMSSERIIADIAATPATAAAILAAVLAFLSGVLGPFLQFIVGEKQAAASQSSADAALLTARTAGNREIARLHLDEYREPRKAQSAGQRKLAKLGTQLDLLLNRDDQLQGDLWMLADKIYYLETYEQRQEFDKPLMEAGRAVLKGEWEKVKREMRGSEFHGGSVQNS